MLHTRVLSLQNRSLPPAVIPSALLYTPPEPLEVSRLKKTSPSLLLRRTLVKTSVSVAKNWNTVVYGNEIEIDLTSISTLSDDDDQ